MNLIGNYLFASARMARMNGHSLVIARATVATAPHYNYRQHRHRDESCINNEKWNWQIFDRRRNARGNVRACALMSFIRFPLKSSGTSA